ncbi:vascular endothelial growth factor A-like isoform X2 [Limulus polyphemus]|uniref:Vascular endothelial growth factor A-like isoform X2 n=1 Tax=Limulus polyphemus TaxID=6850 RepID=A0ABM1SQ47_LIMPO|nr:vascular endothelial growth factor A-like isoform X2 [Limulus polyphemus]
MLMYFSVLPALLVLILTGIYADDEAIVFPESNNRTYIDLNKIQIPESILIRLKDVKNSTEFITRFLISIPLQGRLGTIFSANELAPSAGCEPESQIVELPKPVDPLIVIWPTCTRIKKCGGCCPSTLLECVPKKTSKLSLKVLKAKYSKAGDETFQFQSFEVLKLDVHEKCSCECKEKPSDCTSQQTYRADECRCMCTNHESSESCGENQIWDSKDCGCKCKNYLNCSTGFYFNPRSCSSMV